MSNETRMQKWKSYRDQIDKNLSLQSSVLESDLKISILYDRLLKVYPEYPEKYKTKDYKTQDIDLKDIEKPNLFDVSKAELIIDQINENESKENVSLQYIDDFKFSSGQLDKLIEEVKIGKASKSEYVNMSRSGELKMSEVKKINLSKGDD